MERVVIDTREEYDYVCRLGYEPLIDRRFIMAHALRVEIQREKFGEGNHEENNVRFYRWVWEHKPHWCEECMRPLTEYSAVYVSHISSRGAAPELAYDFRNTNILCGRCHSTWEHGRRENMRIFPANKLITKQLKKEYEKRRD